MKIYINNHPFHYEIENVTRLFFPYEKLEVAKNCEALLDIKGLTPPCIVTQIKDETISVSAFFDGFTKSLTSPKSNNDKEDERLICSLLFKLLTEYTAIEMPWGMITGVRPVKYYRTLASQMGSDYASDYFKNSYFVTDDKINLAKTTEKYENDILNSSKENSFSLYISIPFCPSRCSYCSFVSQSIEKTAYLIEPYVDYLCKEIRHTGKIVKSYNLVLETVYIGGGTPTTLNPAQLNQLINTINSSFDMSSCREFTVEAGRPDTINEEKLRVLKSGGVTRVSINPQTLNDNVLKEIGRKHTTEETLKAFELTQKFNFDVVNSDLIAGLPTDTTDSFKNSLDTIIKYNTENITIHTLSIKRSAHLTEQGIKTNSEDAKRTGQMLKYADEALTRNGYIPYYLYRQSRMVGNYENVGWSKKGKEGLYNVFIMDETHTILACGAGAVTKLKNPRTGTLERIFNYKFPYEYIDSFQEIINRKEKVNKFLKELNL